MNAELERARARPVPQNRPSTTRATLANSVGGDDPHAPSILLAATSKSPAVLTKTVWVLGFAEDIACSLERGDLRTWSEPGEGEARTQTESLGGHITDRPQ